jgi:plastocyanin
MGLRGVIGVVLGGGMLLLAGGCSLSEDEPDLVAGKQQFVEKCGSCHIMRRAETNGTQGPNLDEAFHQALRDGMRRSGIAGAVESQIDTPARLSERDPIYMPADLVTGDDARNVAAYVAAVAARPGEDQGLLADAVKEAGGGEPAVARDGELEIPATAQLAYETNAATAEPGQLTIASPNPSGTPHNIALEGGGVDEVGKVVQDGGVSEIQATVKAGEYTFYCSVPGHREGGMEGTLTVKK